MMLYLGKKSETARYGGPFYFVTLRGPKEPTDRSAWRTDHLPSRVTTAITSIYRRFRGVFYRAEPTVPAILAPRTPSGLGFPVVVSRLV